MTPLYHFYHSLLMRTLFWVVLVVFCVHFQGVSQKQNVRFQHLTTEQGLPQNMVDCILQDSQGFMWFGTWNGLTKYDGYGFEVFNKELPSSKTLGNNFIYALHEDNYGNIWVGTRQGLYIYLYDQDVFVLVGDTGTEKLDFSTATINVLVAFEDSSILIGSDFGVTHIRTTDVHGNFKILRHYDFLTMGGTLSGTTINNLYVDTKNRIWVATDHGFNIISRQGILLNAYQNESGDPQSISSNSVFSFYEESDNLMWIGTEFGLNRFSVSEGAAEVFLTDPKNSNSLPHNTILDMVEIEPGKIAMATLGGFSILQTATMQFTNFKSSYQGKHHLSNDFVNCLKKDNKGNIWIGTERGGVNFYHPGQNIFEHFVHLSEEPNSLTENTINSIYEDERYLWIGTAGGGLNQFDKKTKRYEHFTYNVANPASISSDFVTSITCDQTGKLWVGTWGGGINLLPAKANKNTPFTKYQTSNATGFNNNFISSLLEDAGGNFWIGTLGGLMYFDSKKQTFTSKFSASGDMRISGVGCLLFDKDSTLWVGTRTGLFAISSENDTEQIEKFEHQPGNPASISGNYIISLLLDSSGELWIGTYGQGINHLLEKNGQRTFKAFNTSDGISNNIIYGILEDDEQNLWLSTDYGLSRFNTHTRQIRNFFSSDGLVNNQYYWAAAYKNRDGKLYFGGMDGLDAFFPAWIKENDEAAKVVITDIRLLNEPVQPLIPYNGVVVSQKATSKTEHIELSYKEKILGIEFSSLNYQDPGLGKYAYILEGLEQEWNFVSSNRRYASYTNLKPGKYTFKVKASNPSGGFDAPPTTLAITIVPPFWETAWFRLLAGILAIGLVLGYIRWRTYSLKLQKLVLERQVKERTEQIEQQKDALSYQAVQLQTKNKELEENQQLIEGQNIKLEKQNKEILAQRDELIKLNKKLKLVSQLKLSFFTNISHEFRTPLTLIVGPLAELLKSSSFNSEIKNTLKVINRNAQRLLHLVNQIMDFRKIETGKMELLVSKGDFASFCANVCEAFEPLANIKGIDFHYTATNMPREVWYDSQKFENILYNLLSNAFKYTPNDGTISVLIKGMPLEQSRLQYTALQSGNAQQVVSISITDSGIGISEEDLPLVFKRFNRIASEETFSINGSGIGLALTEELIKTHHGAIFVKSEKGKGSEFEIQFPCLKGAYEGKEISERHPDNMSLHQQVEFLANEIIDDSIKEINAQAFEVSKTTVLVVEDNHDLRKFIVQKLQKSYNVLEANDGLTGLNLAEKYNPDMIISDVVMPGINGLELCKRIKSNFATSHIPIILLTSKSAVEDKIHGLESGADDYLPKPFNFEYLTARIQNLIDTRHKLRLQFLESADFKVESHLSTTKDQKFLESAIQTVTKHMDDNSFGVTEFVKMMGISRSLLHKKLSALTNQSTSEFINHLRMKRALEILKTQERNISEVAYAVGYNDPKYFTRLFTKQHGKSPKEFIEELVKA